MSLIEAVCCSVEDVLAAERAGAGRIELCSAIEVGGLTPSLGFVMAAREAVKLPMVAMVRPRAGGFACSAAEVDVMARDAAALITAGVDGLVFAALLPGGGIDLVACERLLKVIAFASSRPMQTVFHRAFDALSDLPGSLEVLVGLGFTRILTSGGAATALEGVSVLRKLVERAKGRIEILPAGGVRASNARSILDGSGAVQLHLGPMRDVEDATAPFYGTTHRALDEDALRSVVTACVTEN